MRYGTENGVPLGGAHWEGCGREQLFHSDLRPHTLLPLQAHPDRIPPDGERVTGQPGGTGVPLLPIKAVTVMPPWLTRHPLLLPTPPIPFQSFIRAAPAPPRALTRPHAACEAIRQAHERRSRRA
eukprot:gene18618-biopygen15991